jgi:DtxR family transcriptional regulator, Mn-dependent transcriptional regulator
VADTDLRPDLSVLTELLEVSLDRADRAERLHRRDLPAALGATEDEVATAVDHLVGQGTLTDEEGVLALTEQGYATATTVVRRHRLAERLLRDVIGLDWWKVHHEAEAWESVISADVEAHLIELLGDPGTCPHGNPIPGSANRPSHPDAVRIGEAPVGPVYVVRVTEELETHDEALQLLEGCGFLPGSYAEVKRIGDDGSVEVAGSVRDGVLSPWIAHHTYVAPR